MAHPRQLPPHDLFQPPNHRHVHSHHPLSPGGLHARRASSGQHVRYHLAHPGYSNELRFDLAVQQLLLHKRTFSGLVLPILRSLVTFLLLCDRHFLAHHDRHSHLESQCVHVLAVIEPHYQQMVSDKRVWFSLFSCDGNECRHGARVRALWSVLLKP